MTKDSAFVTRGTRFDPGWSLSNYKKMKEQLLPCPACDLNNLRDCYVYIKCENCLMEGPKANGGRNDDHADEADHIRAIKMWNALPRKIR